MTDRLGRFAKARPRLLLGHALCRFGGWLKLDGVLRGAVTLPSTTLCRQRLLVYPIVPGVHGSGEHPTILLIATRPTVKSLHAAVRLHANESTFKRLSVCLRHVPASFLRIGADTYPYRHRQ
jgi:hypothetical protein